MIEIDIEKLHAVQYEILVEFDRVCKKYGLTYFLAFGTLLGAVRHQGFIPWDDDIDTLMPYDDYVKLKKIPKSEWKSPYFFQSYDTDKGYKLCFCKVRNSATTLITEDLAHWDMNQGVDIDIYPLVNLCNDHKERKKQYFATMLYMLLRVDEAPRNHGKIYYIGGKCCLAIIPNRTRIQWLNKLKSYITSYQSQDTEECYIVNGNIEVMGQVLKSSWFKDSIDATFGDRYFPIPIGGREWLSTRYGVNYMELPPKEMQGIKLDGFVKIDLDNSYEKYKGIDYCIPKSKRRKVKNNRWVKYT